MNPNNTNFPLEITNKLNKIGKSYDENKEFLKYHQYITEKYIIEQDGRGILCYYETGQGKTYLAVGISEYYRKRGETKKIIILTAKSLASNFRDSLKTYMEMENTNISEIDKHYKFISSNASNVLSQLKNIDSLDQDKIIEDKLLQIQRHSKKDSLENSLIIVDEAHNLFNSISNGSKNAIGFYDMVLNTKNVKLIFLTGTPIINNPFELVGCFNMLYGFKFFPEIKQDFNEWFIDYEKLKVKNSSKFSNFLLGKISYYGSRYMSNKNKKDFPTENPISVIKVPMSSYQYSVYSNIREEERREASKQYKKVGPVTRFGTGDKDSQSTYRVKSRQASNFVFPEALITEMKEEQEFIRKIKDKKEAQKRRKMIKRNAVDGLTKSDVDKEGLKKYSPKMLTMLQDIYKEHKNGNFKGVVYSGFVTSEGLGIFSKVLEEDGWVQFKPPKKTAQKSKGGAEQDDNIADEYYDSLREQWDAWEDTVENPISKNIKYGRKEKKKKSGKKKAEKAEKVEKEKKNTAKRKTYAIISGEVHSDDRDHIKKVLNSKDNIRGEEISLLLLSSTGAEGLDLSGIRFIQLMEGYWNYARIKQIIARGVRYKSHSHLPENERIVQPYIYLSDYPSSVNDTLSKEESTTDIHIWKESLKNQIIIDKFLLLLMESSVDCQVHKNIMIADKAKGADKISCKMCDPTDKKLYYLSMTMKDNLRLPNSCESHDNKSQSISAKELILDGGKKVYYTIGEKGLLDKINVYEYNPYLEAYLPLKDDHPLLPQILKKIVKIHK